jgi:uncharacterized protein (DUF983 family)
MMSAPLDYFRPNPLWIILKDSMRLNFLQAPKRSFLEVLVYALRYRCPNCHHGPIFKGRFNQVLIRCPNCGLGYFRESGYFVGGMILTYGLTIAVLIPVYLVTPLVPELAWLSETMKYALWISFTLLLAVLFVRPAYALWLSVDYWLEPWPASKAK